MSILHSSIKILAKKLRTETTQKSGEHINHKIQLFRKVKFETHLPLDIQRRNCFTISFPSLECNKKENLWQGYPVRPAASNKPIELLHLTNHQKSTNRNHNIQIKSQCFHRWSQYQHRANTTNQHQWPNKFQIYHVHVTKPNIYQRKRNQHRIR